MSDPGPYQSRLLNLLVPQYRRLVEKGDRAIRQMKVAASWAAQVVIYPVYLLLQTTRVAFRQLGQAVKSQIPQLQATVEAADGYDVDTPIGQVLQAALPEVGELVLTPDLVLSQSPKPNGVWSKPVDLSWAFPVVGSPQTPLKKGGFRKPPLLQGGVWGGSAALPVDPRGGYKGQVIRGLATELTSKNLVLVTADNQELDIFTVGQQKELQQLIIWQLAKYRRHQRQMARGKRPPTWGKLAKSKTTLLPIRLFGQMMAWEQQGTVARTIDLFGESSLVYQPRTEPAPAEPEAIQSDRKLDSFIAAWEGKMSFRGEGSTQIERQTRVGTESPSQTSEVTDGSEREKQNILGLLGAAIAYFFGSQGQELGAENSVEVKQLTESSSGQSEKKEASPVLAAGGSQRLAAEGFWGWQAIKNQVGRLRNARQLLRLNKQEVAAETGKQIELERSEVKALGNSQSEEVTDDIYGEKSNILAIIGAAIAYFFGNNRGDQNLPGSANEKVQQLTGSFETVQSDPSRNRRLTGTEKGLPSILGKSFYLGRPDQTEAQGQTGSLEVSGSSQNQAEDWVTWSDIFCTPAGRGGKLKPTPGQAAPNMVKGYQRKQAVPQAGAATASEDRTPVATTVKGPLLDQQAFGDNIYIQLTPDWIETPATPSGYVKHPLENILEWLDRGILWLEDRAIGIWKWFVR
ncbi:MAG: hypothetical protein AB4352_23165 [Hormoscilla sp.]